jgi:hypothetical protein
MQLVLIFGYAHANSPDNDSIILEVDDSITLGELDDIVQEYRPRQYWLEQNGVEITRTFGELM